MRSRDAHIRAVAKKVVIGTAETKFTYFQQIAQASVTPPTPQSIYIYDLIGSNTAIFPALGDAENQRDGEAYMLLGFHVMYSLRQSYFNQHVDLTCFLVKVHPRYNLAAGQTGTVNWFKQSAVVAGDPNFSSLPQLVGPLDKSVGTVIKRWTIKARQMTAMPTTAVYAAVPAVNTSCQQYAKTYKLFIPVKKRIQANGSAAEVPLEINKYALVFHHNQLETSQTAPPWIYQYVYTQAVFKDV